MHIEIDAALKAGIPVVPVYVDGAEFLHAKDLPDNLKELARLSGITLSTDARHFQMIQHLYLKFLPYPLF